MKITFLGTSATWPLPRKGRACHCKICQSKDKKDKRFRSALLLTINHKPSTILVDCGPDIVRELRCENIKKIDAIIITHAHSDHIAGLKGLELDSLVPVYALNQVHQRIKANFGKKVEYKKEIIKPYQKFRAGSLEFIGLPVIHSKNFPTIALKLTMNYKLKTMNLIYMPDYKEVPEKSKKLIKNTDILILGGAILSRKIPWHKPIVEGIKLAKELKAKKVYFTHIGHQNLPHKELVKFVQKQGGKQFKVAYDGLTLFLDLLR